MLNSRRDKTCEAIRVQAYSNRGFQGKRLAHAATLSVGRIHSHQRQGCWHSRLYGGDPNLDPIADVEVRSDRHRCSRQC